MIIIVRTSSPSLLSLAKTPLPLRLQVSKSLLPWSQLHCVRSILSAEFFTRFAFFQSLPPRAPARFRSLNPTKERPLIRLSCQRIRCANGCDDVSLILVYLSMRFCMHCFRDFLICSENSLFFVEDDVHQFICLES